MKESLLELIYSHLKAHRMAQWQDDKVIERLSELLLKLILKRFDVTNKQEINQD